MMKKTVWCAGGPVARFLVLLACVSVHGQWLNYPSPGTPRGKDGRPNLEARAPRAAGRLDLSGVWQVEPVPGEVERLLGKLDVQDVPGDDLTSFSKYFFDILADFPREQAPLRPEALAQMRSRPQ